MDKTVKVELLQVAGKFTKAGFIISGATVMSSAAVFLLARGCLDCVMVYWIPGTNILAGWVYPTSVFMIGGFLIAYGLKFGIRGLGLVLMVCGAFDVGAKFSALYLEGLSNGAFGTGFGQPPDPFFWFENLLMAGGYLLAGLPKLRLDKLAFAPLAVLAAVEGLYFFGFQGFGGFHSYQVWEFALFVYIFKTTSLRDWWRR